MKLGPIDKEESLNVPESSQDFRTAIFLMPRDKEREARGWQLK